MAGKLFNIYSGNTGGVLSTSITKVGSFGTTSDDFYSVNFDTGRKSIWTNNIEFGRAADWGNISGIPSWIGNDGVTWANVKDKPATATRWPYWSEILSKPAAIGSATQPVYWDGSTFQLVNSVAPATHDHDTRYLKLTGGTLSGDLAFSHGSSANDQHITWASGTNYQRLKVRDGQTDVFIFQYSTDSGTTWSDYFTIQNGTAKIGTYTVYHSGNLPAYPTVNNGSLYLQANGTTKVTFYANQSSNSTFNIATGSSNGTISVGSTDVAVKGLGSNAYSSTDYLPLAGGQMTGNISWKNSTALPEQSSPQYFLVIDAFADGGATKWSSKANTLNALTGLTSTAKGTTSKPLYWDGSKFVECLAYSQASVNYANSAGSVDWSNVQNKPSTFTPSAHDHTRILYIDDRDTVETPTDVAGKNGIEIHFKNKSKSGITSSGTWTAIVMLDGYSDVSGGYPMELGFSMSDLSDSRPLYLRTPKSSTEWGDWRTILDSKTYTDFTVKKDGTGATGTWGISITGNAGSADKLKTARTITINGSSKTFDGSGNISWSIADLNLPSNEHNHDDRYLKLSGGTLTGVLHLLGSQYADTAGTGALDLANSDIYGVNSIKFADLSDGAGEGLQWYRDATHTDSLWVKNGVIYFTPNRTWGGTGTDYTIYHSGNLTAATLLGSTAKGNSTKPIYWNGSSLVECIAYSQASVNYANSAGNADTVDNKHASDFVYTAQVSEEQNSDVNTWAQNNADTNKRSLIYNTSGREWSYLSSLRSDGAYGAVIKFGYNDGHPAAFLKGKAGSSWYSGWVQFITSDNIGSQSVNYATSAGSANYATSAGNADTLDTFHAADLFQTFTNDATNNAVKIKIGNTEKSLVVGYATKAGDADKLDNIDSTGFLRDYHRNDDITSTEVVNTIDYIHNVGQTGGSSTTMAKPSGMDNAWGILHMHLHTGNYAMQLGFGGTTGHMYFRNAYNTSTFGSWVTLLDSTNSSVSKSGETLSVKINGTTQSLTNTWRGITDSYNVDSPSSSTSLSQKGAKALYSALINGYANEAGNADTLDNHDSTYFHIHTARSYTSVDALPSGSEGWYNIFTLSDNSDGAVICTIKAYAHSSLTFIASKGYSTGATLQILQYNSSSNGSYFYVKGVRIVEGGKVQALFNKTSGTSSYISVNINIFSSHGTLRPNTTLTLETGSPTVIAGPLNGTNGKITSNIVGNITGKAGSADSVPWSGITGKAVSKTAWGQTFVDASGNIQSISGNMTSVGQVTPDGNATRDNGTSSANWSSVYSYNLRSNDNLTLRSGTSKDIIFQTNAGTEYMRLTSGGNLGIGTNSPTYKLHVKGSQKIEGGSLGIYPVGGNYNDGIRLHARSADNTWAAITFCASDNTGDTGISANSWFVGNNSGNFYITKNGSSSSSSAILYCSSNKWYINTTSGSEILNVGGWIGTVGNVGWYSITHGGGWYMDNSTYVKSYNSKSVYTGGGMYGNGFYHIGNQSNDYVILGNGGTKQWSASKTASTIVARTGDNFVYAGYYNSDISNEDSISVGSVYVRNTSDNFIRRQSIGKFADNLRSNEIISIDKSLTVTEAWMDTGIVCDTTTFPRGTGTYAVQIKVNSSSSDGWSPCYSGIMTIFTENTNGDASDEVPLHVTGHATEADSNFKRIYIKTIEQFTTSGNPGHSKIQIAASQNMSASHTYTFKFRKLI